MICKNKQRSSILHLKVPVEQLYFRLHCSGMCRDEIIVCLNASIAIFSAQLKLIEEDFCINTSFFTLARVFYLSILQRSPVDSSESSSSLGI
jgi:hypothetical protein